MPAPLPVFIVPPFRAITWVPELLLPSSLWVRTSFPPAPTRIEPLTVLAVESAVEPRLRTRMPELTLDRPV